MADEITLPAPAKINLSLRVTGRRGDGYHTLQSLVAFADTGDVIRVAPADGLHLAVNGPYADILNAEPASTNLAFQAALKLKERLPESGGASITLTKQLPVAAGMGGGSSDAATTLNALASLWGKPLPPRELALLALELGADVPACLHAGACWLEGIGETISPIHPFPTLHAVLVNPGIHVSTPSVFRALHPPYSPYQPSPGGFRDLRELLDFLERNRNDLLKPATLLAPEIDRVLDVLAASGCLFRSMSGSGATCFALYRSRRHAEDVAKTLKRSYHSWWVEACVLG